MKKSATIRARMEPDLKDRAEYIFRKLGLSTTQALTLFYRQVELRNGLPFDLQGHFTVGFLNLDLSAICVEHGYWQPF